MTHSTHRFLGISASVLFALLCTIAFASPTHAYVYGNPPTASGAITTASSRCTGPVVANLGGSGGSGTTPSWASLAWSYLSATNLPSNYNDGSYCIDAELTVTSSGGGPGGGGPGGGEGNLDFNTEYGNPFSLLVKSAHAQTSTWTVTYAVHSGTGTSADGNSYSLTYTPSGPPTASLTPSPATIQSGSASVLTWNSTQATSCTGTNFSTGGATGGSVAVAPTTSTTYSVSCSGPNGTATQSAVVNVQTPSAAPAITSFTASPSATNGGDTALSWSSTNAAYCTSAQFDTEGATSGTKTVAPSSTTTYTLTCTGEAGTGTGTWHYLASDTTDMSCPWTDLNRPYPNMTYCDQTPLVGSSCTNPPDTKCKINSGSCNAVNTDIYSCNVTGPSPSVSGSATVTVAPSGPVTATLTATPSSIGTGGATVLSWSSTNASWCSGAGGDNEDAYFGTGNATSGSVTVSPTETADYSVTCYRADWTSANSNESFVGNEWWSGGTQTKVFQETLHNNGQQGALCAAAAGGNPWNVTYDLYPNKCGDAGCPLVILSCYAVTGATGTVSKPAQNNQGRCVTWDALGCHDITYFRSSGSGSPSAPVGTWATDTETVTVGSGVSGSCSVSPNISVTGQSVTWSAVPSGGTGSYTYSWTGSEGLMGTSQNVTKAYTMSGNKYASVTITSGAENVTVLCDGDATPEDGVVVISPTTPTATLTSFPTTVASGTASMLTWSSTNAASCIGTGFATGGATSGSVSTGLLTATSNYQVTCDSANDTETVSVTYPAVDLVATPDRVNTGATVQLTWTGAQVSSCVGTNFVTGGAVSGTVTSPAITGQTVFTVSCDNGTVTDSAIVNVVPKFDEF